MALWCATLAAAAAVTVRAAPARANGRFPRAQYVVVGPGAQSSTLAVRTTFAMVVSDDAAESFHFLCEEAFQYVDGYDPSIALSRDDALLVGVGDGLVVMDPRRCTTTRVAELAQYEVVDLTTDPTGAVVLAALASSALPPEGLLARSDDGGRTFRLSAERMANVRLETVEVAPSNPARVYATATELGTGRPLLLRSDDGGTHLYRAAASLAGTTGAFVSAVDASRADVLYLRATLGVVRGGDDDGGGLPATDGGAAGTTVLLRSDDGGASVREVGRTQGAMRGFALADDGRRVWIGGPDPRDGLLRSDDGGPFTRVADVPVECLRYHAGALYVCETFAPGGVMLAAWRDEGGRGLVPLVRFDQVQQPPRCAAGTIVGDICALRWPNVRALIAPGSVGMDGGVGDAAGADGGTQPPGGTCGCRAAGRGRRAQTGWVLALVALGMLARGRRGRGGPPPSP